MRLLALLLALLLPSFLLVPSARADGTVLDAATSQHLAVYRIVRDFHALTLLSGDPTRTADLKALIAEQGQLRATLATATGNATADAALKRAAAEWPAFSKFALANNFAADGYTDDRLIADLDTSADRLDKALGEAVTALQTDTDLLAVHQANVLLLHTAASYLKRAAQLVAEIGGADDFDIALAAGEFDKRLPALQKRLGKNREAQALLAELRSKWDFIKPRLLDYNEKTVPFIVDRYARQMSEMLVNVAALKSGSAK